MSQSFNRRVARWKDVESLFRRSRIVYLGADISGIDKNRLAQAVTFMWIIWENSSLTSINDGHMPKWIQVFLDHDVHTVLSSLDAAGSLLTECWDTDTEYVEYRKFKQSLSTDYPFIGTLLGPIKEVISLALRGEPECARRALTCLWFLKKFHLHSDKLAEEAEKSYLDTEANLRGPVTLEEREIITKWFPKESLAEIYELSRPHHGNGSTADAGNDLMRKYQSLSTDPLLHYMCKQAGFDEWNGPGFFRLSKTVFVPKSYKSYRTISEEPATLMWYQEGINVGILDYIYTRIPRHPLSKRFDPRRQKPNRVLAQEGSDPIQDDADTMCTIDLKAASDSVTLEHIKAWFLNASILVPLLATRSIATELPSGRIVKLRKFAPMGNALNFTVEVITFCAIVEAAIASCGDDPSKSKYRVYGDDIVIESKYFDAVVQRLETNGFTVNRAKSFAGLGGCRFRESCGGFYLNTFDVTPLIISRKFNALGQGDKSTWVPSTLDLINNCYCYEEARNLRAYLINRTLCSFEKDELKPIFSTREGIGIRSEFATNWHLWRLWDDDWQTSYYCHGGLVASYDSYDADALGPYMLYEWLRQAEENPWRNLLDDDQSPIQFPRPPREIPGKTFLKGTKWSRKATICDVIGV